MELEYFRVDYSRSWGENLEKTEYDWHDELDFTTLIAPCKREEAEKEFLLLIKKAVDEYDEDPDWRSTSNKEFYYEWRNDGLGWVDYIWLVEESDPDNYPKETITYDVGVGEIELNDKDEFLDSLVEYINMVKSINEDDDDILDFFKGCQGVIQDDE